ncbi:extracellular solute-binding protein [Methylocella sp. CPCC 101449]|uniref:extracellular solute-binding protein n=1 Tax=Methylocella sp. CPCC 101449 TaxID=2987531 RepID=UPI00288F59AB|nr:extracellular solute-binding protein [Methylocella sp. CPCC 101449]MDT2024463.1 extracellular solute-binding protein [Methylocella sp. CPCC 101449]
MKRQTIRPSGAQLRRRDVLALAAAAGFAPVLGRHPALAGANGPQHGLAMHGAPALPPDFPNLPYANPAAPKGGRLAMGFQGTFDSLNPFNLKAGSTAQGLNTNIFQTLMTRSTDEPFTLYGLIAETIETDADRSFATFRLNPLARFSDGQLITSADLAFSFDLLKRKGRPQHRAAFSLVKSVDVPDERTIRYDLTGIGDRELPLTLALMPVLAKHRTDADKFDDASLDIPTGSGPYRIDQLRPGELLLLKRNPDYWAKDLPIHRGLYNFDEIRIEYFRDGTSFYEAVKAGVLDYREETNPTRWISGYNFPAIHSGQIKKASLPLGGAKGMIGFAFNTRREIFGDVRVREALGYMFDFEWINANLFGDLYRRTKSFFDESELSSSGVPASAEERALLAQWPGSVRDDILEGRWTPPRSDGSGRDRANARKALDLFALAGWRVQDGALKRAGRPFIFEIMVTDRNQERLSLNFAQSLQRIGVEARVRQVDEVQYQRRRQKFDFDMMIGTWTASNSPGNEQRNRWSSASAKMESSFNLAGASQPALDGLIGKILAAKSKTDFIAAVRAFDRVLLSGFYIIPLYHAPDQWVVYSRDLVYPERLPKFASPLFGATLDTWWRPGA